MLGRPLVYIPFRNFSLFDFLHNLVDFRILPLTRTSRNSKDVRVRVKTPHTSHENILIWNFLKIFKIVSAVRPQRNGLFPPFIPRFLCFYLNT